MFRYSMLTLLFVVSVLALFSAALVNPTRLFLDVTQSVALLLLLSCTLLALLGRSRNPFAVGFAVTGWIYFVLAFSTVVLPSKKRVPTNRVLYELAHALHEDLPRIEGPTEVVPISYLTSDVDAVAKYCRFEDIGHYFCTVVFAAIGGLAAMWIQRPHARKHE